MVTMSLDNVIKFPESTRGPLGNHDRARLLKEARALVAQKLRETTRALLAGLQEDLLAKGDAADERERRNFFYGGRDILRDSAVRIEGPSMIRSPARSSHPVWRRFPTATNCNCSILSTWTRRLPPKGSLRVFRLLAKKACLPPVADWLF
jgi:hypothetical protein